MSYLRIQNFIDDGKSALKDKHYLSALSLALMLPSIAARLEFCDMPQYRKGRDKKGWEDKKCYVDWCNNYMSENSWLKSVFGNDFSDVLYQLRCDIIHAGCADIFAGGKSIYFLLNDMDVSSTFANYRMISISELCHCIFETAEKWTETFGTNNFACTYIFDTANNRDDNLLYHRLRDKDRADYLEEQFLENEKEKRKKKK